MRRRRRGAAVLEMAIVLALFLTLTMGMLDLGVGVFRYHVLSQAVRHVARRAIVHGETADVLGTWGTSTIDVAASATGVPAVDCLYKGGESMLVTCDLDKTRVRVEWPEGSNAVGEPVRVTVTSPYRPVMTFIFPATTITLSATSTMKIAH